MKEATRERVSGNSFISGIVLSIIPFFYLFGGIMGGGYIFPSYLLAIYCFRANKREITPTKIFLVWA